MAIQDEHVIGELREAFAEIQTVQEKAIARAREYLMATKKGHYETFMNGNGYQVRVDTNTLLDVESSVVSFFWTDVQGKGLPQRVDVPRDAILGEPTEEEKEYAQYLKLREKFGDRG